jgi:hypothetical protein
MDRELLLPLDCQLEPMRAWAADFQTAVGSPKTEFTPVTETGGNPLKIKPSNASRAKALHL